MQSWRLFYLALVGTNKQVQTRKVKELLLGHMGCYLLSKTIMKRLCISQDKTGYTTVTSQNFGG